ncbi:hypothetical protein TWF481_001245 [Arthrobotrys musiformis]|uniref:Uncharacterized protein n=1 Tax=Arthrobotrys musiformis TaxID=47236 RepID=A0AAV9WR34_9PEZI
MAQNDFTNVPAPRLDFRPTLEIVQDFDCVLYLLAGIFDYDDHPMNVTPISDVSHDPESYSSSSWIPGRDLPRYQAPDDIDDLRKNFAIFNHVRIFCKENLEIELEKLRKEANSTVEYLTSKGKFYEATALVNLMMESPSSYTTKSIEARISERASMDQALPYFGALVENEKNCGRLFYFIKSATIPSTKQSTPYELTFQYSDIKDAQSMLQKLINERLLGSLAQIEGAIGENTSTVYHKIDPLEHRACLWKGGNVRLISGSWYSMFASVASKRNLLGEASIYVAKRHAIPLLEVGAADQLGLYLDSLRDVSTDIRGGDIIATSILAGHWDDTVSAILKFWVAGCRWTWTIAFFSPNEVPGLKRIQKMSSSPPPNDWVCLSFHQLVTLMGKLGFIERAEVVAPALFPDVYSHHPRDDTETEVYSHLTGKIPLPALSKCHIVALSALAGYTDITRHYLENDPTLYKSESSPYDRKLVVLLLIAFKMDDQELLHLLNDFAPFKAALSKEKRITLSRQTAEIATPDLFQIWMNLAWTNLDGYIWEANSNSYYMDGEMYMSWSVDNQLQRRNVHVRCALWRAILESLYERYEGTQGTNDEKLRGEKAGFMQVIWVMEQSMYFARCVCERCQGHYLKAYGALSRDLVLSPPGRYGVLSLDFPTEAVDTDVRYR